MGARFGMSVPDSRVVVLLLAACVAVIAAVFDLRRRSIPNLLTGAAVLAGITFHSARSGWSGLVFSLLGMAVGGGALLVFYVLGGMGAGDVKLMGGIGALVGAGLVISVLVFTGLFGGIMAIGKLIMRHMKKNEVEKTVFTSERPADNVVGEAWKRKKAGGDPMKETMPYGVAIAVGTLLSLFFDIVARDSCRRYF
jgi:prepilin peptidase CpaA